MLICMFLTLIILICSLRISQQHTISWGIYYIDYISNNHGIFMKWQPRKCNLKMSLSNVMIKKQWQLKWFSETYWIFYAQWRNFIMIWGLIHASNWINERWSIFASQTTYVVEFGNGWNSPCHIIAWAAFHVRSPSLLTLVHFKDNSSYHIIPPSGLNNSVSARATPLNDYDPMVHVWIIHQQSITTLRCVNVHPHNLIPTWFIPHSHVHTNRDGLEVRVVRVVEPKSLTFGNFCALRHVK